MGRSLSRRDALRLMGMGMAYPVVSPVFDKNEAMLKRAIPSSGEMLPVVGLGTWRQFDVGKAAAERNPLVEVLNRMNGKGGKTIDSSPMYARSEEVIGDLSTETGKADNFFYATKVWTTGRQEGVKQMEASMRKLRRTRMDLIQIHNLVDWETHIQTLREWKQQKKIRYIGVTHYVDSAHKNLEDIVRSQKLDFVQFNYSIRNRHAEERLLNAAKDSGTAVIINQPFESGYLFNAVAGKSLPSWVSEYGISNWAQYFLKYLLSHPAVTCVIPGTSDPVHVVQNMEAAYGKLPDEKTRGKMISLL
jgi:diketogulonate reductase-like aldo/keto reductase